MITSSHAEDHARQVSFTRPGKTRPLAFSAYDKDIRLLDQVQEHLGCSRSETVRSAIRHLAMALDIRLSE